MHRIFLAIIGAFIALLVILVIFYGFKAMNYKEPYQTNLYCLESTSRDSEILTNAIKDVADKYGMVMLDRSADVTRELDELDRPRPKAVLHGSIEHGGNLVLSYSNLGSNDRILHISIYSDEFTHISRIFDKGIREVVTPRRIKVISGGEFDSRFCERIK